MNRQSSIYNNNSL